ncbi:HAD family hydrolase [Sinanaerobacter sp. ZZT-01]|uniref:HAD family hydrolase n=1 Tax=Sinanaerobacter sp. ZZT-01 TaxID=3111540 RepID=UPI002D78463A|nr:HAD family hydrolase [Sinanaerobacter sp. ZZT-01]WRR93049.1 HAD family hydrolase [Sinanaerobacter sp. ZZT-01]
MKKYKTIVFDLDGTLLNSLEDLCDSTNAALNKMGYPLRSIEEIRSFVGNGVWKLIERAVPNGTTKEETERCFTFFEAHYEKNKENKTRPYEGIIELLQELKKRGYRTAVISNKYHEAVGTLTGHYFSGLFNAYLGETEGIPKKPAPDGVRRILELLHCQPFSAIMVGDSDVDILTAKNADLRSVGVTWGYRTRELLKQVGADYIIDEPKELLNLLDEGL